jgi:hypothetical protein
LLSNDGESHSGTRRFTRLSTMSQRLHMRGKDPVYRNERGHWFIVFVDIGDLSVKVYGVGLLTQQSRMFWSEDLGGDDFARAVSERLGVGFGVAEELISREDDQAIDALIP